MVNLTSKEVSVVRLCVILILCRTLFLLQKLLFLHKRWLLFCSSEISLFQLFFQRSSVFLPPGQALPAPLAIACFMRFQFFLPYWSVFFPVPHILPDALSAVLFFFPELLCFLFYLLAEQGV